MHQKEIQSESTQLVLMVEKAMHEDLPIYVLLAEVEKAVLGAAMTRHRNYLAVCKALKIPRATFFLKKKRYFE